MAKPTQHSPDAHHWDAWIGTDEAGKGDYFGSLAVAGVYVTPETRGILQELGVRDGKQLTDSRVRKLADQIHRYCSECVATAELEPSQYNKQYDIFRNKGQNLNNLLASLHARVIRNLLQKHVDCRYVLVDRFASEDILATELQRDINRSVSLVQIPKAESDIGVAAASIVARDAFLQQLEQLSTEYQIQLPKGAFQVIDTGKQFVARHGAATLQYVAKQHFRTTMDILGKGQ